MGELIALPASVDAPVLLHGDCLDMLARLPDASVHVAVTDPPAGIGFMHAAKAGRTWDSFTGYQPRTARGREVAARHGDDPLIAEAANALLGFSLSGATEDLPARETAAWLAEALRDRYTSPLARLPAWAVGFVAFMTDVWTEVDRVLKPGGWICAWALPKTSDLAGLAGRAVGWEVHDSLLHLFGGGMPKGDNISKRLDKMAGAEREVVGTKIGLPGYSLAPSKGSTVYGGGTGGSGDPSRECEITAPATESAQRWDGWNTQLAPGYEQWLLFRKPTRLTYAANAIEHCTGVLHVDACRIPRGESLSRPHGATAFGVMNDDAWTANPNSRTEAEPAGSWPRNVVITCGGEECPAEALDRQKSARATKRNDATAFSSGTISDENPTRYSPSYEGEVGGASRFFTRFEDTRPFDDRVRYQAKASDRGAGLRTDIVNAHPTHKHVDLMRWLVRLIAATAETTGGEAAIVLDPFMGRGSVGPAVRAWE